MPPSQPLSVVIRLQVSAARKKPSAQVWLLGSCGVQLGRIDSVGLGRGRKPAPRAAQQLVRLKNPADGIRSQQEAGEAANTKRLPFKPDQISRIFAETGAASPKTALYWLPLLMLTAGARPNELAQLRTDDLGMTYNGRPNLNVLYDEADSRPVRDAVQDDPRRVKTAAGRRMIPLYPILIQTGFIAFVQERHGRSPKQLFRELKADQHGFWSSAITKRLNRIIRKLGITNPRYTAYSMRH